MYAIINLEGRLVADPEFRIGREDREYCTLRLAVNQRLGPQENTTFYGCTGNEFIAKRIRKAELGKGRIIQVVGNLTVREYTDRNGVQRMSADVGILDWHFVDSRPRETGDAPAAPDAETVPASPVPAGRILSELEIPGDTDDLPL